MKTAIGIIKMFSLPPNISGSQLKIKRTKYRVSGRDMAWQDDWSEICRGLLPSMPGVVLEHLRMSLEEPTHSNAV